MLKEHQRLNTFKHVGINVAGGRRETVLRAFCSTPGCEEVGEVRLRHGKISLTPEHAEANFRKKHWELGDKGDGRRDKDKCPVCVRLEVEQRREQAKQKREQDKKLELIPVSARNPDLTEDEVQQTSNEERAFILDYIESHLQPKNEELDIRRYKPGWNDARILVDLQSSYPDLRLQTIREMRLKHFGFARRLRVTEEPDPAAAAPTQPLSIPPDILQMIQEMQHKISQMEGEAALSRMLNRKLTDRVNDLQTSVEEMEEFYEQSLERETKQLPTTINLDDEAGPAAEAEPQPLDEFFDEIEDAPAAARSPSFERVYQILSGFLSYGELELYDQFDSYFDELRDLLPRPANGQKLYRLLRLTAGEAAMIEDGGLALPPHRYSTWTTSLDVAERRASRGRKGRVAVIVEQEFTADDIVVDLRAYYEQEEIQETLEWPAVKRNAEVVVEHDPDVVIRPDMVVRLVKPKA